MGPTNYPLTWPAGWPRAKYRLTAKFSEGADSGIGSKRLTLATAFDRLENELSRLGAKEIVVSTNRERRVNGAINAAGAEPADPGVAIYFKLKGRDTSLACDKWERVADNVNAIAKHIEAIRGMERWGVGSVEQVFTGYQALPAPEQWWQVLGVSSRASVAEIEFAHRRLIANAHPDRGGAPGAAGRINAARDEGKRANG